jgi:hypothetical protein
LAGSISWHPPDEPKRTPAATTRSIFAGAILVWFAPRNIRSEQPLASATDPFTTATRRAGRTSPVDQREFVEILAHGTGQEIDLVAVIAPLVDADFAGKGRCRGHWKRRLAADHLRSIAAAGRTKTVGTGEIVFHEERCEQGTGARKASAFIGAATPSAIGGATNESNIQV